MLGNNKWLFISSKAWDIPYNKKLSVRIVFSRNSKITSFRAESQAFKRRNINSYNTKAFSWIIIPYSDHWIWSFLSRGNQQTILTERKTNNWFWMTKEKSLFILSNVHFNKSSTCGKEYALFIWIFRPLEILARLTIITYDMIKFKNWISLYFIWFGMNFLGVFVVWKHL